MARRELAARDCGKLARQGFWRADRGSGRQRGTDPPLRTTKRDAAALQPAFACHAARSRACVGDEPGARRPPPALFVMACRALSRPAAPDRSRGAAWAVSRSDDQCARSRRRGDSVPAAALSRDTHRPGSLLSRQRNAPGLSHQRAAPSGGHRSRHRSTRWRDEARRRARTIGEGVMSTPYEFESWNSDVELGNGREFEDSEAEWEAEFRGRAWRPRPVARPGIIPRRAWRPRPVARPGIIPRRPFRPPFRGWRPTRWPRPPRPVYYPGILPQWGGWPPEGPPREPAAGPRGGGAPPAEPAFAEPPLAEPAFAEPPGVEPPLASLLA